MSFSSFLPSRLALLFVAVLLAPAAVAVADCQKCDEVRKSVKGLLDMQNSLQVMKSMNEATLAKMGESDAGRKIKIRSNLMVITVKLETLENQLKARGAQAGTQCRGCGEGS